MRADMLKRINCIIIGCFFMALGLLPMPAFADASDEPGTVAGGNVIEIHSIEQLIAISENLSADYILAEDLDLSGCVWTPIGSSMPFTGTFEGNGHTIKGLSSSGTDGKNGLFGVNNGTIKNIHLAQGRLSGNSEMTGAVSAVNYGTIVSCSNSGVSCNASGDTNDYYVGGITGINYGLVDGCNNNAAMQADNTGSDKDIYIGGIAGSSQTNSIMADCNNAGEITAAGKHGTMAGGIAGSVNHSVIKDCGNIGSVNGTLTYDDYDGEAACGGITGEAAEDSSVSGCFNTAAVTSLAVTHNYGCAGGITGRLSYSTIGTSYNAGSINGWLRSGGITGENFGTIRDSYNVGEITGSSYVEYVGGIAGASFFSGDIARVYNVGRIVGDGCDKGSITGDNAGTIDDTTCFACGWGIKAVGTWNELNIRMLSGSEMARQSSFVGFDFAEIWRMGSEQYKYPVLRSCADSDHQDHFLIGWQLESGERHFYSQDHVMLKNGWAEDDFGWCWLDAAGNISKDRWIKTGGVWYYLDSDGYMVTNKWRLSGNTWYYLKSNGAMAASEWVCSNGSWYYFKSDGAMASDEWIRSGGEWYYLKSDGTMAANEWIQSGSHRYYMNSDGSMASDEWIQEGEKWYYADTNGLLVADQWVQSDGNWYYLKHDGVKASGGWLKLNENWYYLDPTGARAANKWVKSNSKWYYMLADGTMATNRWIKTNGTWYRLLTDGSMAANRWVMDGNRWYHFNESGAMESGKWIKSLGKWYYLETNGVMAYSKWIRSSGKWYYVESNGAMAYSKWIYVSGKWYYLKNTGEMATGNMVIKGRSYSFNNNGEWIH